MRRIINFVSIYRSMKGSIICPLLTSRWFSQYVSRVVYEFIIICPQLFTIRGSFMRCQRHTKFYCWTKLEILDITGCPHLAILVFENFRVFNNRTKLQGSYHTKYRTLVYKYHLVVVIQHSIAVCIICTLLVFVCYQKWRRKVSKV